MKAKIGVYVCECGPNIAEKVDIDQVLKTISSLEEYEDIELVIRNHKLLCSNEGKEFLENEINENQLTHMVVAACSPRDHNTTFINVCKKTSLNPYLYQMVNIREHCAWIIPDKEEATKKAIQYIRGGIGRVLYQSELEEKQLKSNPDVLVVGGGIAGIEAALSLAGRNRKVTVIEKTESLGGKSVVFKNLLPRQGEGASVVQNKIKALQENGNIEWMLETELDKVVGFFGNFEIALKNVKDQSMKEIKVGAVVVATGFQPSNPAKFSGYQFKEKDNVYTALQIEKRVSKGEKIVLKSGEAPKSVALVHCVGREGKGYCSKICCSTLMKIAGYFKEQLPKIEIKEYFRDLCLPNKEDQKHFDEVQNGGVEFIRFKEINVKGSRIQYTGMDDSQKEASYDMIVLAPAMEPGEDTEGLAEMLGVSLNETGFFQEAHQTINPVATTTEGVYIIGAAHGPRGISSSILTAQAAAGKILTMLIPGEKIIPEIKVSEILESFCTGCKTCLDICCYGAIEYDENRGISVVNEAICRGCGNCAGSCPSGAIRAKHFTSSQLYQEVIEAVR